VLQAISVKAKAETDQNSVRATTSTIGRGNQELRDIPQSVTVVTEKLMEDRRVDTVKEALHYTAGISFQAAEGGEEDIRLRGFSLTASGDIFVDGVRDTAFYERDVFNFDRIEVLRGSASMLFGRGSTGGVVNQVSKTALPATVSEVSTTIGSGSYLRLTGDFNLKTSETSALRLNAMTTSADNYGNAVDKYGVAPTFRWGIGTADEFSAGLFYLENRNGINYGIPWLRKNDSGPISETNPAGCSRSTRRTTTAPPATTTPPPPPTARSTTPTASRTAAPGTPVLRSGGYDRDQRASTIRYCVRTTNPQTGVVTNPDCPTVGPTQATVNDATPLTRGTANKVQDLQASYLQTDYTNEFTWFGRPNELLAGVDLSREEFNNFAMVLPAGVVLDKNNPRTTVGTPNDGTSVEEGLRTKVKTRNFVAKAIGVYAQDIVEVVEHWKLLAGLRWDRFDGDYVSPPTSATPQIERSRSDSLWSQRFGVLWQPNDSSSYYASYGTSFNTSGELYNYDAQGSNTPPEKSRNIEVGAKFDLFAGQASARVALFHSTKYNERNRDSPDGQPLELYVLSGKRHAAGLELDLAGASSPAGRCSSRTPSSRGPRSTRPARRHPDRRAARPAAVDDAAAQRHPLHHLPADAGAADRRRPERAQLADAQPQPARDRGAELGHRRPAGRVRVQQAGGVQVQRHQRHQQAVRRFALHRPLHPRPAAHLLRDHDGALLNRRDILRRCCCTSPRS
jgi:catecholate siderophore receptor